MSSSLVAKHWKSKLIERDVFGHLASVAYHTRFDSVFSGLRQILRHHEVVEIVVEAWHLINQGEVTNFDVVPFLVDWQISENLGASFIEVEYQILQLFFMHLEVLHN